MAPEEIGHSNGASTGGGGMKTQKKAHVLFVTIPYMGHFMPLVQLLYHLEARYPGLTVTVWGNKDRLADLEKMQGKGDLQGLDLRLVEVFGKLAYYPDPVFPARPGTTSAKCFEESEPFRKKLVAEKGSPGGPTAIVASEFQQWSKYLADELGIPWYTIFAHSPTFVVSLLERSKMVKAGIHPRNSPNVNDLLEPSFTGLPHARIRDLREDMFSNEFDQFYKEVIECIQSASAILLNTSEELDSSAGAVVAMRKVLPSTTRVWTIGPSLQCHGYGTSGASDNSTSGCLQWLDSQPAKSVLYVAFGSIGSLSKGIVMELAAGLEASGVPFLWALSVKDSTDLSDWLPRGFVERTKGHGFIETAWAPQVKILAHSSTGGFLSHCGWNSLLESLCAGVPLIAWPLGAEQPLNARFVADVAKVGMALCYAKEEDKASFENITRHAVTKAVRQLMLEEKGVQIRSNAEKAQKSLCAVKAEGGSSHKNMNTLLEELAGVRSP